MLKKISHRETLTGLSYVGLTGCSAVFLLTLAAMLFAPAASQQRAAAVEGGSNISAYAVTPTVGISLPTSIDFADVLPTPSGATTTATADLTITTSDSAGYSLYLYSSDGDNSLKPKISSLANISQINATAGDVGLTLSSLEPNTWGYNLGTSVPNDNTTYSAVPTDNSTPIQTKDTSDTNSAKDTYTLSFGAKVDTTTASGAYSNTLTIAVVAEPKKISSLTELTYMQEMTPEICASSQENDTTRLIDVRDGKYYWVAKLADGGCWMTQNLDLDLTSGQELTPDTSDVSEPWNPGIATFTSASEGVDNNFTVAQSWSLGDYVVSEPGNIETGSCSSSLGFLGCTNSFTNIEGQTAWNTDVNAGKPPADLVSFDNANYDAHFLVGNHYSFQAATAGTAPSKGDAPDSICPAGWILPPDNVWLVLLGAYGFGRGSNHGGVVYAAPLYFVRAGRMSPGFGLNLAGRDGSYLENDAINGELSGYLSFYEDDIASSTGTSADLGFSVRCVAE